MGTRSHGGEAAASTGVMSGPCSKAACVPVPLRYRNWDKVVGVWRNNSGDCQPKFTGTRNQITVQQNQHRVRCDIAAAAVSGRDTMSRCDVANESDATISNTSDAFVEAAAFIRRQYAAEDAGAFSHDGTGLYLMRLQKSSFAGHTCRLRAAASQTVHCGSVTRSAWKQYSNLPILRKRCLRNLALENLEFLVRF